MEVFLYRQRHFHKVQHYCSYSKWILAKTLTLMVPPELFMHVEGMRNFALLNHTHMQMRHSLLITIVSVLVPETTIMSSSPDLLQGSELFWPWPGPLQPEWKGREAGQRDHPHVHRSLSRLDVLLHPTRQHGQGLRPRHHHPVHHQDFRSARHGYWVGGGFATATRYRDRTLSLIGQHKGKLNLD